MKSYEIEHLNLAIIYKRKIIYEDILTFCRGRNIL